ncbi:MAG: chaperone modulator CbpM [Planctomycetota bacterium]|jgi:hypothetical protein
MEIHGERWVTLEAVAEAYAVEETWLREVYAFGLLGPGERVGEGVAVSARMLERVAVIRRLSVVQGVNLPGIAIILDMMEESET